MPKFEFRFECANLEAAGAELRRLARTAQSVGFEMKRGKVVPAPQDERDDSGGMG